MGVTRFRCASTAMPGRQRLGIASFCRRLPPGRVAANVALLVLMGMLAGSMRGLAAEPLRDAPVVWYVMDRQDIPAPKERDPNFIISTARAAVWRPTDRFFNFERIARRVGSWFGGARVQLAANINSLDETPNSTWFTNRIGLRVLTPEEAARGPGGSGPDRSEPWQVISAKVGGVTPGFCIEDARGEVYLLKFDPPQSPGMTIRAGVVANRIIHACGYNVPEDHVVRFRREDLALGTEARIRQPGGGDVAMTAANLDSLLGPPMTEAGEWCALASKFLTGELIGPFDYLGRRGDDPNDRVNHQDRRELRGLKLICAWINHFDTKEQNSLDVYVEEDGHRFVRHYLIDFASSLGTGGFGPNPKLGYEFGADLPAVTGRLLALGFHDDYWYRLQRPAGLPAIGYLEDTSWDPREWKPLVPNSAFANLDARDAYWAVKIVSAFTTAHLKAIVAEADYRDPRAAEYLVRALAARRDRLARYWFDRMPPLDFFRREGAMIRFHDLGVERGIYRGDQTHYRVRWSAVTEKRRAAGWTDWREQGLTVLPWTTGDATVAAARAPAEQYPFLSLQCQVNRGRGWSKSVTIYLSRHSGRIVALDR